MNINTTTTHEGITDDQKEIFELMDLCKEINVFEFEGVLFLGHYVTAVKKYVEQKPSAKFFIWLQNNYKMLTT